MPLLPALDIHFTVRVEGPAPDLPFLGPTVRGLLGYGLRQSCCGHDADGQGRCSMGESCAYSYLFEGPLQRRLEAEGVGVDALPQPFVTLVDPPDPGRTQSQRVTFGFRLLGTAIELAPQVAAAVLARERFGFGARSLGFVLEAVALSHNTVWTRRLDASCDALAEAVRGALPRAIGADAVGSPSSSAPSALSQLPAGICTVQWEFRTPLSLRPAACGRSDMAERLLDSANRRAWLLERAYGAQHLLQRSLPHPIDGGRFATHDVTLQPIRIERRSTRHGRVVVLTGDVGTVSVTGPWRDYTRLLAAIERYGLGQSTTFGFGRVRLSYAPQSSGVAPPPLLGPRPAAIPVDHRHPIRSKLPRWVRLRGAPPSRAGDPRGPSNPHPNS